MLKVIFSFFGAIQMKLVVTCHVKFLVINAVILCNGEGSIAIIAYMKLYQKDQHLLHSYNKFRQTIAI